jgi:hypothetical protein
MRSSPDTVIAVRIASMLNSCETIAFRLIAETGKPLVYAQCDEAPVMCPCARPAVGRRVLANTFYVRIVG